MMIGESVSNQVREQVEDQVWDQVRLYFRTHLEHRARGRSARAGR